MGIEHYPAFVAACILLNLTPGADTLYILTRSVTQGRRAGLWSAGGILAGCLVHTSLAALGLSLLLAASAWAFAAVKLAGAGYLVVLGLLTLFVKQTPFSAAGQALPREKAPKLFVQGLATNVLNPKVALFFLAFLPPFVNPATGGPLSFAALGLTFIATGTVYCLLLVLSSTALTRTLRERPRVGPWLNRGSGIVYLGMGTAVFLAERP